MQIHIDSIDWKKVEQHYAQYTPDELAQMCTLSRCPACEKKQQCFADQKQSYQDFLEQTH